MSKQNTTPDYAKSLIEIAERKTRENSEIGVVGDQPPTVVPQSPLLELMIDEVTSLVPPALAAKLQESRSPAAVSDWIGAGAMYSWLSANAFLAKTFLREVGNNPKHACLSLARTVGAILDPPAPDLEVVDLDRQGLFLQILLSSVLLLLRGLVLSMLSAAATGVFFDEHALLRTIAIESAATNLVWLDGHREGLQLCVILACAIIWLCGEAVLVPMVLQRCRDAFIRKVPARQWQHWRKDSLAVAWTVHVLLVAAAILVQEGRVAVHASQKLVSSPVTVIGSWLLFTVAAGAVLATIYRIVNAKAPGRSNR